MTEPARLSDLAAIDAAVWRELGRAALDRHHEWRTLVLATADAGDGWPDARTVVLREVQADQRQLVVYSDARAAKVAQLQDRPRALLVLWSRRLGWQLRLRVTVALHVDGLAATSRWLKLRATPAAHDYLSPLAPGQPLPGTPDAAPPPGVAEPTRATVDSAAADGAGAADAGARREHFAVLACTVQSADWLELHRAGHRRARFDGAGARWLVP